MPAQRTIVQQQMQAAGTERGSHGAIVQQSVIDRNHTEWCHSSNHRHNDPEFDHERNDYCDATVVHGVSVLARRSRGEVKWLKVAALQPVGWAATLLYILLLLAPLTFLSGCGSGQW